MSKLKPSANGKEDKSYQIYESKESPRKRPPVRGFLRTQNGDTVVYSDPEAVEMSEQFPEELIGVFYKNGIPVVMSLKDAIKEVMAKPDNLSLKLTKPAWFKDFNDVQD